MTIAVRRIEHGGGRRPHHHRTAPPLGATQGSDAWIALWDPATGRSTPTASLVVARTEHTATLLQDGRVLLVGSHTHGPDDATAEVFQPIP